MADICAKSKCIYLIRSIVLENSDHTALPKVGEVIYVPTDLYLTHGADDFHGGKAQVVEVVEGISAGLKAPFIRVRERPDTLYNWLYLSRQQEELRKEFGDQEAYSDPDYRPEFNE